MATFQRQNALNIIVGAAEAVSVALTFSEALNLTGVNRQSDMYRVGNNLGTIGSFVAAALGVGASTFLINKAAGLILRMFGKAGLAVFQAAKAAQCFVAGTPVHTSKGLKPIEKIKAGDLVLSWNEGTKQFEYKPVTATFNKQAERLVHVHVRGESMVIVATPEHPFYVRVHQARDGLTNGDEDDEPAGEWRLAGELSAGDELLQANGTWRKVRRIEFEERAETVYNFEVWDNHDYFVGDQGVLGHNNCQIAEIATKITSRFGNKQCTQCAEALVGALKEKGIAGQIVEIRTVDPNVHIVSDSFMGGREAISDTGMHQGVRVGDMVYDVYSPGGMLYEDWLKSFHAPGGFR